MVSSPQSVAALALLLCFACSAESSSCPPECELPDAESVRFLSVELISEFSSSLCPEVTPQVLSASLMDAGGNNCDIVSTNCALKVDCRIEGVAGGGTLRPEGSELVGVLEVTEPLDCSYSVRAEQR